MLILTAVSHEKHSKITKINRVKINTALALFVRFYTEPCSQMNACFQEQRLSFHRP